MTEPFSLPQEQGMTKGSTSFKQLPRKTELIKSQRKPRSPWGDGSGAFNFLRPLMTEPFSLPQEQGVTKGSTSFKQLPRKTELIKSQRKPRSPWGKGSGAFNSLRPLMTEPFSLPQEQRMTTGATSFKQLPRKTELIKSQRKPRSPAWGEGSGAFNSLRPLMTEPFSLPQEQRMTTGSTSFKQLPRKTELIK